MPYRKYVCYQNGVKKYCTKNLRNGKITHYSSPEKRETGIRMREMYSNNFVQSYSRRSKKGRRHIVRRHRR